MRKALLVGNYGAKNKGDELILEGMLALCERLSLSPLVLSHDPEETKRIHSVEAAYRLPFGFRSLLRLTLFSTLRAYMRSDVVFLGGGGLFVDRVVGAFFLWFFHGFTAALLRKPLFLIGHSFELKKTFHRRFLRFLCTRARYISVRDSASLKILKDMGISAEKCFLFPDMSFLRTQKNRSKSLPGIMGVSLCRWGMSSGSLREILNFLLFVLDSGYREIRLFPFQCGNDNDEFVLRDLFAMLPSSMVTFVSFDDPDFLKKAGECSCFLGMRLHSILFSYSLKIPFIALAYQQKVVHSVADLGLDDYVHRVHAFSSADLIRSFYAISGNARFFDRLEDVFQRTQEHVRSILSFLPMS